MGESALSRVPTMPTNLPWLLLDLGIVCGNTNKVINAALLGTDNAGCLAEGICGMRTFGSRQTSKPFDFYAS